MFPTIIVDNFFEDFQKIKKLSQELQYYPPDKDENWGGLRTPSLHTTHPDLFKEIIIKILMFYYPRHKVSFSNSVLSFYKVRPGDTGKNHFHYDFNTEVASVLYISSGDIDNGTTILDDFKEKQIIVSNHPNTLIAYDGRKHHGRTAFNVKKERITLNAFISGVKAVR